MDEGKRLHHAITPELTMHAAGPQPSVMSTFELQVTLPSPLLVEYSKNQCKLVSSFSNWIYVVYLQNKYTKVNLHT